MFSTDTPQTDEQDVINFLLTTEIIPLCLRIMESGSELSKTVATFILQKILLDETGLSYICQTFERFSHVSTVLVSWFDYDEMWRCDYWPCYSVGKNGTAVGKGAIDQTAQTCCPVLPKTVRQSKVRGERERERERGREGERVHVSEWGCTTSTIPL